jgi:two-component system chemotaxis response regulator CheY
MNFNVLVVDDSQVMRTMIVRSLRMCGLPLGQVYEAGDGEAGLRLLDEHWIDLAFVDVNMPVLDGVSMIERARRDPATADLGIVVISTETSETRVERLRAMGAAFLHKPFTPEALRQTILQITGVSHEELGRDFAAAGGELDF